MKATVELENGEIYNGQIESIAQEPQLVFRGTKPGAIRVITIIVVEQYEDEEFEKALAQELMKEQGIAWSG